MRFLQTAILFILMSSTVFGQEDIRKVSLPEDFRPMVTAQNDPSIEGLQWNRWTSKNFVVLCLNDVQAQYLHRHLELVKSWIFSRWGMYDIDFSAECRVICVDDPALYQKMFKRDASQVDVIREDGKIKQIFIFLLINDTPSKTVPIHLSKACFAEFAQKYNSTFPFWAERGMSRLNGSIDQIRADMAAMQPILAANQPVYFSKGIMEMTEETWRKETVERREMYDRNAVAFCLLVRKEFGQNKFLWLLKRTSDGMTPETALKETLGFQGYNHFDRSLKAYMTDLSQDCVSGRTPDRYLQIRARGED